MDADVSDVPPQLLVTLSRVKTEVYHAYMWYLENKHRFSGAIWLPCLHLKFGNEADEREVRSTIGLRDYYAFVCEEFEDLQLLLCELKKQRIEVAAGVVPRPEDLEDLSDIHWIRGLFEAPVGLKNYLLKLLEPSSRNVTPERDNNDDYIEENTESVDDQPFRPRSSSPLQTVATTAESASTVDCFASIRTQQKLPSLSTNFPEPPQRSLPRAHPPPPPPVCLKRRRPIHATLERAFTSPSAAHSSQQSDSSSVQSSYEIRDDQETSWAASDSYQQRGGAGKHQVAHYTFGKAVFLPSRTIDKPTLVYERVQSPGSFLLFRRVVVNRRKDGSESQTYRCNGCEKISSNGFVGSTTVRNGVIVTDPEYGHDRDCVTISKAELDALRIRRQMSADCRKGKRPMQAFTDAMVSTVDCNSNDQATVQDLIGPYHKARRSLYKHTTKRFIPIAEAAHLPKEYQVTLDSRRRVERNDRTDEERFLQYSDDNLLIFSSESNLRGLHQSEFWIGDGTFKVCPKPFAQLYTLHGFINGEGVPLCHALMRHKSQESYEQLFREIKGKIESAFGTTGLLHTIVLDFEAAARNAALVVFKNEMVTVRGCLFHFGQCLIRAVSDKKLKPLYTQGHQNPDGDDLAARFYRWVRAVHALALFPPQLIGDLWRQVLSRVESNAGFRDAGAETKYNLLLLKHYIENTWMRDVYTWNHFDNVWRVYSPLRDHPGPRTTNHAEGWHNKLNSDFGHPHPALNTFMDWLQRSHHRVGIRARQLFDGQPAKQRDARYVAVDSGIMNAKASILAQLPWAYRQISVKDYWPNPSRTYLRRVAYLLGNAE